jgi:16S rRNA (uracil1498-N3)-methyltransferase
MSAPSAPVYPRFLAPDLDPSATETRLPADESRHLARVLRLGAGALVAVFDGRGREYLARVGDPRDAGTMLTLIAPITPAAEPAVPLTLVQAMLKGGAMDDVVRDATMMGAASIRPVLSAHVSVKPAMAARPDNVERWRRIAIAAAKQSRRATIPEIAPAVPFATALDTDPEALTVMFVEPSANAPARIARSLLDIVRPLRVELLIGPEGGWAAEEIDLAAARGARLVTLGSLTLRADATPIAAIAVLRMLWEEG